MATLFTYMKAVQRLINDAGQILVDPGDLIDHINRARRMVAARAQCIRVLTPISGAIKSCTLLTGGSGYTANTKVVISKPDFPSSYGQFPNGNQATAKFTVTSGVITDCEMTYGGDGYLQPTMSFTDTVGTGATVTPNLSFINTLNAGQEVYPFSAIDMSMFPGVGDITAVLSTTVIFSNYRYGLPKYSFTKYQFLIRNYAQQFQYTPGLCAQYGQGSSGSLYVYPLPSQQYQMEWDCICSPQDLIFDESVEVIPDTWSDCVEFYAAHLTFLQLQNHNSARAMLELFEKNMGIFGKAARPGQATNQYGRP